MTDGQCSNDSAGNTKIIGSVWCDQLLKNIGAVKSREPSPTGIGRHAAERCKSAAAQGRPDTAQSRHGSHPALRSAPAEAPRLFPEMLVLPEAKLTALAGPRVHALVGELVAKARLPQELCKLHNLGPRVAVLLCFSQSRHTWSKVWRGRLGAGIPSRATAHHACRTEGGPEAQRTR